GASVEGTTRDTVTLPWSIKPAEYLGFASKDIVGGDRRGAVNGLSNAKRALECQIDSLLLSLDLFTKRMKRQGLPGKLKELQDLGVVAPQILAKINRHRNELEHEYVCPDVETTKDFVDVVSLFVE